MYCISRALGPAGARCDGRPAYRDWEEFPFGKSEGYFELETGGNRGNSGRSCERLAERAGSGEIPFWAVNAQPHQGERFVDRAVFPPTGNSLLDILSDITAKRVSMKKQGAMDAQDEGMGDARDLREFALRRLLREFVEKAGRAETAEGPWRTPGRHWPGGSSCAGCAGRSPWGVVELADMAGPTRPGLTVRSVVAQLYVRDDGGERPASAEQAITGGADDQALAKSVPCDGSAGDNQCSLRFSSLSRLKSGGSVPHPDRLPGIEPRSPSVGFNRRPTPPAAWRGSRSRAPLLRRPRRCGTSHRAGGWQSPHREASPEGCGSILSSAL